MKECVSPFNFSQEFSRISPYWFLDSTAAVKYNYRADSRLVSSQRETTLQSNAVSHWLDADLGSFSCSSRTGNWKSSDDKKYWNYIPVCLSSLHKKVLIEYIIQLLAIYSTHRDRFVYEPSKWKTRLSLAGRIYKTIPDTHDHTHWVTHIWVSDLTSIGSDHSLSPGRRQAIIRTNAGILLIRPVGKNFSEFLVEILIFSFKKMRLKVSSANRRPFCLGLIELKKT